MKALVYHDPGAESLDDVAKPAILEPGDAIAAHDVFARAPETGALKVIIAP